MQQAFLQPEQQVQQTQLQIISHDKITAFPITSIILNLNIQQIKQQIIRKSIGYSSRIHLYKQPICSFNKIQYFKQSLKLSEILSQLGPIRFTYNNTQFSQQPQYNHQPLYLNKVSPGSIQTVVQICQNNLFVHENYRVQLQTRIGFFNDVCRRYGANFHVQYYNTRINLSQFGSESIVENTIGKLVDHMGRLTVTVDSVNPHIRNRNRNQNINENNQQQKNRQIYDRINNSFQQINKSFQIDYKFYFILIFVGQSSERYYVVSRKSNMNCVKYILKVLCRQQVQLLYNDQQKQVTQDFLQKQQKVICKLKKQQKLIIDLPISIQLSQLIGQTGCLQQNNFTIYILQNSSILYRFIINSITLQPSLLPPTILACPQTTQLDQDLFFILDDRIISYAITISFIKVKYYHLDGTLLFLKIFPWYHQLYEIEFCVVDLFCVKLKKGGKFQVRVFYIDDPESYLEIGPCQKFYPAKIGNTVYSDQSGIFAISNHWMQGVQIYSLHQKKKLSQIRLQNYKQLTDAFFTNNNNQSERFIILNFSNKQLNIYNINKGQKIYNILCEKGMKQFIANNNDIWCCMGSQVRIFKWNQGSQQQTNSRFEKVRIDKKLTYRWSQPFYIPQKAIIIRKQSQNWQAFIRENCLQFTISKMYILK